MIDALVGNITHLQSTLQSIARDYQFIFAAVIVPLLLYCKNVPGMLVTFLCNILVVKITVDESDNLSGRSNFNAIIDFISKNRCNKLNRVYEFNRDKGIIVGTGLNILYFQNTLIWCKVARREPMATMHEVLINGSVILHTFRWNIKILNRTVSELCRYNDQSSFVGNICYLESGFISTLAAYPSYVKTQKQYIKHSVYEQLYEVFDKFVNNQEWYISRSRPYKEVCLLYGVGGTGKTSVGRHLASLFNCDMVLINPSNIDSMTFSLKSYNATRLNGKTVFLIEDITSNTNFIKDHVLDPKATSLNIFLNTLDGVYPLNDVIVIITTNHLNKLDEYIYRDGRVDHLIGVDYVRIDEVADYLEPKSDEFMAAIKQSGETMFSANTLSMLDYTTDVKDIKSILDNNLKYMKVKDAN